MHVVPGLKVLYFGTPVVLISSRNEDGTTNIAPMSSAWWLGQSCMLGLDRTSQTPRNIRREGECVLNLPSSAMAGAVDSIALLTGTPPTLPEHKVKRGYRYEPDKLTVAGLTEQASDLVRTPRIRECPIQMECRVLNGYDLEIPGERTRAGFYLEILRTHVEEELLIPGTGYIDPLAWDPLIMKFTEYFGGGHNVHPSALATGWQMPHQMGR